MSEINISNLTFGYDGQAEDVFENVSFRIDTDWKLGLIGRNGREKTTFLKLLSGKYPYSGKISATVEFKYFPCPVSDTSRSTLEIMQEIQNMSEGQKKKVLLARSLCQQAHLYIWDEPLNYIDVLTRMQIEDVILRYQPTLLFVEHDHRFEEKIATKAVQLRKEDV